MKRWERKLLYVALCMAIFNVFTLTGYIYISRETQQDMVQRAMARMEMCTPYMSKSQKAAFHRKALP